MRNINYFDKELSVEEYVKKEVCKNAGTQSVAFKEQLISLCSSAGIECNEKMKKEELRRLIEVSLFAALILVGVQFLRIQVGPQFVHLGNALVVIAVLVFGSGFGALAAALGLGLFDIFNGYAAEVWITILESLLVCYVLHLVYEKAMKANDKPATIFTVGLIAAVTKIIVNLFKYTLINSFIGGLALLPAMVGALAKITGTFGTSIVTIVAVPILYPIFKRIVQGKK